MRLVQILDCNDTLGTCCNDYTLVTVLDVTRKILGLIQMFVPIILIIFATFQFIKMMTDPEEKKLKKALYNKFFAAVIVFMIPILVNVLLGVLPEKFSVSACWEQAKISAEVVRSQKNTYIPLDEKGKSPIMSNPGDYDKGSASGGSGQGSAKGKAIVAYAKQFVGKQYLYGGSWNGEMPYTPTDCSGFVQGVFKHNGINLTRSTTSQWADKGSYTLFHGEIKAGDWVMYDGHVAILTGNGNEIVHAKGRRWGIVVDSDYKTSSSHAILGIMRINGVN